MEAPSHLKPELSIILPAMLGYDSVQAAVHAWESQTCRDRLEILVLCPDRLGPTEAQASALPAGQVIVPVGSMDLHEARAIAIHRAAGDYVMLAEDHCLPDPGWAQAILDRLEEGWDAVGSGLRPGNRTTRWAEGSFLLGYAEWMLPVDGGPSEVLCGWNGTIRTQPLRALGSELSGELLLGAFLVRRLHRQGLRFYLEDRAQMRHFDPPAFAYELYLLVIVGLGYGAMRTRSWPLPARLLYPLAAPAVAFLHWKRAFVHYRRAGRACGVRWSALLAAVLLACAWGLGEAVGALVGTARVAPVLWRTEVKPVSSEVVENSAARERLNSTAS
jgi:hypothetical protein